METVEHDRTFGVAETDVRHQVHVATGPAKNGRQSIIGAYIAPSAASKEDRADGVTKPCRKGTFFYLILGYPTCCVSGYDFTRIKCL